jgi:hypothetical protein
MMMYHVILDRFHLGQDEIGQLSRDTSSLQDMTSPEINEVHEGGIEVQDEIGQVSRDTSSLQDITSPEITSCTSIPPSCTLVISGLVISCNDDVSRDKST